jgi:hypothetical protein
MLSFMTLEPGDAVEYCWRKDSASVIAEVMMLGSIIMVPYD